MNRYKILSIILSLWCFTTMAMEKKEEPNLKEKTGLNIAKDLIKVYDSELLETKSSTKAFNKIEQYLVNKNLPKDLIEYIYCLISINLNRNDIFFKEIFKKYAESQNLDLFYNLCPQAQYIIVVRLLNTMIHYAQQTATEQKHISREIEQLIRDIIKLNSNRNFANKLYAKLLSIYKNLSKVTNIDPKILTYSLVMKDKIYSLIRELENNLQDYFKDIDINKEMLNFEKELMNIAQEINKQARKALEEVQQEDIISQIIAYEDKMLELLQNKNNEEESYIKNVILNYYNKFGSIFIYKAFDKLKEELNKNYDLDHKLRVYFTNQVEEIIKSITEA